MNKISDRELAQLENDDLEVPVQKFKKKGKINKPEKFPEKSKNRRKPKID